MDNSEFLGQNDLTVVDSSPFLEIGDDGEAAVVLYLTTESLSIEPGQNEHLTTEDIVYAWAKNCADQTRTEAQTLRVMIPIERIIESLDSEMIMDETVTDEEKEEFKTKLLDQLDQIRRAVEAL